MFTDVVSLGLIGDTPGRNQPVLSAKLPLETVVGGEQGDGVLVVVVDTLGLGHGHGETNTIGDGVKDVVVAVAGAMEALLALPLVPLEPFVPLKPLEPVESVDAGVVVGLDLKCFTR